MANNFYLKQKNITPPPEEPDNKQLIGVDIPDNDEKTGDSESGDNDNNGNAIIMLVGLIFLILAPIFGQLMQLAISRKREYSADATAVKFMRTPSGLVGALTKIKSNSEMKVSGSIAPLFIAKPNKAAELFSTHPPLEKRIEILKKM